MQFQYNADYPAVGSDGSEIPAEARDPSNFPHAQPIPCARITTRVYHPCRNQVATVQNVLVRTISGPPLKRRDSASSMSSDGGMSSSSNESMAVDDRAQDAGASATTAAADIIGADATNDRAYWVQRTVREAIYGRVLLAIVLRRRDVQTDAPNDNAEWEVTTQHCAVKEMSWQHIRKERGRLAEDPIKEVSAMQFLKQWHSAVKPTDHQSDGKVDGVLESFQAILETNIMMPLDLLSDDRNLYSVMPYCDGGELFERLDSNESFPEEEARYWMHQVLNVSADTRYGRVLVLQTDCIVLTATQRHTHPLLRTGSRELTERGYLPSRYEFGELAGARVGSINYRHGYVLAHSISRGPVTGYESFEIVWKHVHDWYQ